MSNKEYRPTLAQLRTFVTIAENKHFGTAATKLHISQPSLSQALVALETGLGVQLIERSTRKVIVTAIGEALLPYAKETLEAADTFLNRSRGAGGELTGPLTIGMIPTIAPYLLPALLPAMREKCPELQPSVVEDRTAHLLSRLRDGQLDLALMALPSESSGMIDLPLYTEEFIVVVPADHELAGRHDLTLSVLDDLDLLLLDEGHCLHDQIIDLCRRAEVNPSKAANAITRASSLTTLMQLVANGFGATLVPLSAVEAECHRPGVAIATFADSVSASREVGLVYRSSSSRAHEFEHFGSLITEAYRDTLPAGLL
ncbi:LysR family transcriptional regulator [Corynebacterium atypicum]|uniref:Probable hydrogen peroxide-inducible genes activator n=1 Tax=Corynebacterium atypicum TaxID=191610 RepID=A0ABM5QMN6_9CORY|nr:hydrogen peroxide-inducible genes activator [Corynebacterium atypicum]AIG64020.1 LysR family transcriptional regulator [Corynebacterium atypicum]